MRRLVAALPLVLVACLFGQNPNFTSVTATITDPNGTVYANGYGIANFVPGSGGQQSLFGNGQPFQQSLSFALDGTGTFTVSLADNTRIVPASSQWKFTICAVDHSTCFSSSQTVSGTTQSLSSALSGAAVAFYALNVASIKVGAGGIVFSNNSQQTVASVGGSVTSVATTAPLTGGPITTTGTVACATCTTNASALTNGQLVTGAGGQATQVGNLSGDATTSGGTAVTVTKTNGVAFATSATTDTTNAANITSGTLPNARIVALPNANLANSSITVNTTSPVTGGATPALGGTMTVACATCATTTNGGALSGTAPVTVSAAGAIACPTCATTTNGGALAGTAPVAVSAAGAISVDMSCGQLDNVICTSSVDANGNPNYITTTSGTEAMPINGGTTSLVVFINGTKNVLSTNVTLTIPSTSGFYSIFAKADSTGTLVAADFGSTNIAPSYVHGDNVPALNAAATTNNPQYYFNLDKNSWQVNTNGGSGPFATASPQVIFLYRIQDDGTQITQVTFEPYRLNPYRRYEVLGNGQDGNCSLTSGATTRDGILQCITCDISGTTTTLTHTQGAGSPGLTEKCQNPKLIVCTSANCGMTAAGKGRGSPAVGTGAGSLGNIGGYGGTGGGGGGSGTVSAAGGGGGARAQIGLVGITTAGGTAGAATPTAGGAGPNAFTYSVGAGIGNAWDNYLSVGCTGASGGNGAGDATSNGGAGGAGGGCLFLYAPSILIANTGVITCSGTAGSAGAGGNAAGGGGGGGGTCHIYSFQAANTNGFSGSTFISNGGAAGAASGTGTAGGAGGTGYAIQTRLW